MTKVTDRIFVVAEYERQSDEPYAVWREAFSSLADAIEAVTDELREWEAEYGKVDEDYDLVNIGGEGSGHFRYANTGGDPDLPEWTIQRISVRP